MVNERRNSERCSTVATAVCNGICNQAIRSVSRHTEANPGEEDSEAGGRDKSVVAIQESPGTDQSVES